METASGCYSRRLELSVGAADTIVGFRGHLVGLSEN